ncbi:MAG: SPOR domain-containing protein [Candidatus Aminicenantes bacterium]|nr:SPOR domain-containing protein [Candidatus Aminicenantes bacterium]
MKNKDFREIQVSSSLLVVIFLGVLALGVFIFLLGVSVGKKQVRIASQTQVVTQQIAEPVKEPPVEPTVSEVESAKTELLAGGGQTSPAAGAAASKPQVQERSVKPDAEKTKVVPKTAPPAGRSGLYYVQIAAFAEKAQAQALADRYKKQGYTAFVADPKPTDTRTWFRVRLGGFSSRDPAVALLNKLNTEAKKKTDFRVIQD